MHVNIKGEYLKILAESNEFQTLFASDSILDELEKQDEDKAADILELTAVLGGVYKLDNVEVQPLCPAVLSFLWMLKNPYLNNGNITALDTDIFLYVLSKNKAILNENIQDIILHAEGFAIKTLTDAKKKYLAKHKEQKDIDSFMLGFEVVKAEKYQELKADINRMIAIAYRAYRMFPQIQDISNVKDKKNVQKFDADWITKTVSIVHKETGLTPDKIMWNTPLTACAYYYIQYCREKGVRNIEYRPEEQKVILIWKRTADLCKEFLMSKGYKTEDFTL